MVAWAELAALARERVAPLRVETAPLASHLDQELRWRQARCTVGVQPLQRSHHTFSAQRVDVAERSATERWEPDAEYRAHVPVPRRTEDALLKAPRRFVHHGEHAAPLNLVDGHLDSASSRRQQLVH